MYNVLDYLGLEYVLDTSVCIVKPQNLSQALIAGHWH